MNNTTLPNLLFLMKTRTNKRRRQETCDGLHRQSKVKSSDDSLEVCLNELEASTFSASSSGGDAKLFIPPEIHATNQPRGIGPTAEVAAMELLFDSNLGPFLAANQSKLKEQAKQWNRALRDWIDRGVYIPGLLPSFEVELVRHFQIQELSTFLLNRCINLRMPSFERWIVDARLEGRAALHGSSDLVLFKASLKMKASQRLIQEITETEKAMSNESVVAIVDELCRRTTNALQTIQSHCLRCRTEIPLRKGDRIDYERRDTMVSLAYHRKRWKKPFFVRINDSHYNKLLQMFLHVHGQTGIPFHMSKNGKPTKELHVFHLLVMATVLRYSSFSGGQLHGSLRGGGMQGTIHSQAFRVLRHHFPTDPLLECFGSTLNSYLPFFGSAFPDIDWHFGSIGDFFEQVITQGCCEANPPFAPGLMDLMVDRIESHLGEADQQGLSLSFVVIVPTGDTGDNTRPPTAAAQRFAQTSFERMISSSSLRLHLVLTAKEHGFVEGAQHLRPTRFKTSGFNTSIILLQSRKARLQDLGETQFEEDMRSAFASRHQEEIGIRMTGKYGFKEANDDLVDAS